MAMEKIRNEKEPDERYQLIKKPRSRRQAHNERMAFAINDDEERLAIDMFKDYNRLIHPLPCGNKTSIVVDFGIALILLINIDEKNQVMQTNVWLTLAWNDCQFNWNPSDYGGIESLRVAIDRIWQPDVVLFNNCDGMYETSYLSNAVVDYKGDITWVPPAIFKSFCRIDVEFFPFDEQVCTLIFGSWTYQDEIKFNWYGNKRSVELNDYSTSSIWDLIAAPGCLILLIDQILCSEDETRLVQDLFRNYNHLVRPVPNTTTGPLEVMHTNVWLTLEWDDYQMSWDPTKYGKLSTIRLPPDRTWHPEIVLFNNADGQYEVSFYSNVVVSRFGRMLWVPPAIYKSSCQIEVEFFPFDEQVCSLIFGSWTYNEREVILKHKDGVRMVDLSDYSYSGIWDIVSADGELIQKKSKISYQIKIRRKPLFYSVILLIPTILMAFLSIFVLYLPTESSEKITLAISLLLALVVFLLLTSKILPPTSSTIPLLAKYLLLTFVLNIITILVTVVIINIYFRRPTTHTMNFWVRIVFLKYLPILLMMRKPTREKCIKVSKKRKTMSGFTKQSDRNDSKLDTTRSYIPGEFIEMSSTKIHRPSSGTTTVPNIYNYDKLENNRTNGEPMQETNLSAVPSTSKLSSSLSTFQKVNLMSDEKSVRMRYTSEDIHSILSEDALKAITAVEYITEHLKQENQYKKVRDEWKFIATCLDRLLMYIFFAVTVGATIGILLSAPNIFDNVDQAEIIARLQAQAQNEKNNL